MSEQLPLQGPQKGDCGCQCGAFGTYRKTPWRNGVLCVRNCDVGKCANCRGSANHSRGHRKQAKAAKRGRFRNTTHEDNVLAAHRWTHKDDKKHAAVIFRVWDALEAEDNYKRPIGDSRPLVETFSLPGQPRGKVLIDDDDASVYALALQRGLIDGEGGDAA